jgi:hypothetical protein
MRRMLTLDSVRSQCLWKLNRLARVYGLRLSIEKA